MTSHKEVQAQQSHGKPALRSITLACYPSGSLRAELRGVARTHGPHQWPVERSVPRGPAEELGTYRQAGRAAGDAPVRA